MKSRKAYQRCWYKKNKKRVSAQGRAWRKNNKKRAAARSRAYVKKNYKRHRANCARWYRKNKKWANKNSRIWHLKRQYGLTVKEFSLIRKAQGNRCAICFERFRTSPNVDHDHKTGRIRGLLCPACNTGIGHLKDSIVVVESAANYLRKSIKCI